MQKHIMLHSDFGGNNQPIGCTYIIKMGIAGQKIIVCHDSWAKIVQMNGGNVNLDQHRPHISLQQ